MDKNKKDVEDYGSKKTGRYADGRRFGPTKAQSDENATANRYINKTSAVETSKKTVNKAKADSAYQMSYINKGKMASDSARADKRDAKASALAMMKARKKAGVPKGKPFIFMNEPDRAEAKRIIDRNKRYR